MPRLARVRQLVVLMALGAVACHGSKNGADGVVVRQVLRGADVFDQSAATAAPATSQPAAVPGQVATTLVADAPQAAYKLAADQARKALVLGSLRSILNEIDNQLEQEQESPP